MIYYFTGTGNSLYVARRLAERLGESLESIPQLPAGPLSCEEARIGVVFPTYGYDLPLVVRRFLGRLNVAGGMVFLVPTYGNHDGGVAERASREARRHGIEVAYARPILMGDNWLPGYDASEEMKRDKQVDSQIDAVVADLDVRRFFVQQSSAQEKERHASLEERGIVFDGKTAEGLFCLDGFCDGCGICAQVCPGRCIVLSDDGPCFDSATCQWCLACINWCPNQAIGFADRAGSFVPFPEKNRRARYRNPNISVADIIAANNQYR